MSLYKGTQLLAGVATNTIENAHSLFDFKWTDHKLNEMSWLRSDTYSWQSGDLYVAAYNHLVADISGKTATSETVGSYTISYYLADDGHKITTDETTVANIYNESGVAWYYVLDTTNQRFKLPRTKYGFTGYRDGVGNYVPETLPNIRGRVYGQSTANTGNIDGNAVLEGCFERDSSISNNRNIQSYSSYQSNALKFNANASSSTYQDSAPVQQRATQMYLYFYVGQFSQSATEQTAGLNVSLFNGKVDLDAGNVSQTGKETIVGWGTPDYTAGVSISYNTDFTPDKDGIIKYRKYTYGSQGDVKITVNSQEVDMLAFSGNPGPVVGGMCLIAKGETFKISGGSATGDTVFYPLKGVNTNA